MRSLLAIATDLRAEAPCIAGGLSAPCSDCSLMIEAAEALEKINAHHGVKLRHAEIDEVAGRIAGGNCLQGGLLDACDCYGFQPWIDR